MKKFLLGMLAIVMCFTLVACSNTENNEVPRDEGSVIVEDDYEDYEEAVEAVEE